MDVNSGWACHQGASRLSGKANLLKILETWRKITDRISVPSWKWTGRSAPLGSAYTFAFHHVPTVPSVPL